MRRKPIPQSLFNWIAFLSGLWFFTIEWVLKPLAPATTDPAYLILELLSKASLAIFTGSIFFRITETFRDRKAKDKTEGFYQDFLDSCIHHFDVLMNDWSNKLRTDTPDPYFLTLSTEDVRDIVSGWMRLEEMSSSRSFEDQYAGIARGIEAFKAKLRLERANYAPFMLHFSPAFMKELNAMDAMLVSKGYGLRSDKREFDDQMWDFWRIRRHLLDLSNIYRSEHKMEPLPPIRVA